MGYTKRQQMTVVRTLHIVTAKVGWDVEGFKRDVSYLPNGGRIVDILVNQDGALTIECLEETPEKGR